MNIAVIDADLIGRTKHRFPNLACMKISGYYKNKGNSVCLKTDYKDLNIFDRVYISKVFTDTKIDDTILNNKNIIYGGTGFFYDRADPLPYEIEHHMPDYNLYYEWLKNQKDNIEYYKDYSIGFLTRKCFRGCFFCVNKNYKAVEYHASINEFFDKDRKYICLLDDNILGYKDSIKIIKTLINTNKPFQFKQGIDIRLMTEEKAELLSNCKYKGDYIFAFDNIKDIKIIHNKLKLWKQYCNKTTKLYVFCGYENTFEDILSVFKRIRILMKLGCLPYIMRHENYINSKYAGMYINLARWCNQPNFYKKMSLREFCEANQEIRKNKNITCSTMEYLINFEKEYPEIAKTYFDLKFENLNQYIPHEVKI